MNIPVIVVDDVEADRHIAKRALSRSGGFEEVSEYVSGNDLLQDFWPDDAASCERLLILMDLNMPGKDGLRTVEEIQSRLLRSRREKSVVVVVVSSSDNHFDREAAAAVNIVRGYIVKPIDKRDIEFIWEICANGASKLGYVLDA